MTPAENPEIVSLKTHEVVRGRLLHGTVGMKSASSPTPHLNGSCIGSVEGGDGPMGFLISGMRNGPQIPLPSTLELTIASSFFVFAVDLRYVAE